MAQILLTGGNGYIGSHTAAVLAERGHQLVIVDDFSNSERDAPDRLRQLTGMAIPVIEADIRDRSALSGALSPYAIDAVIHFAALKAVQESETDPLRYYDMNIGGTIRLLQFMEERGIRHIVFSSSATVYGQPEFSPIPESAPTRVENIYGRTKQIMEILINDLARTRKLLGAANLRYFNPVGAHPSAMIGETPRGAPNNLMPYICQVAAGTRPLLQIFGNDYDTPDGTGVRDYIHIMDLAEAHALAVERVLANDETFTVNLGTGIGISVLELLHAFEAATQRKIPYKIVSRRAGDVASYYADPGAAERLLGWKARLGIHDMCRDAWRWEAGRAGLVNV